MKDRHSIKLFTFLKNDKRFVSEKVDENFFRDFVESIEGTGNVRCGDFMKICEVETVNDEFLKKMKIHQI